MRPLDALTEADAPSQDDTAAAAYWLRHPEIAAAAMNTLSALLDKWESEPEWEGPAEEPPCQE